MLAPTTFTVTLVNVNISTLPTLLIPATTTIYLSNTPSESSTSVVSRGTVYSLSLPHTAPAHSTFTSSMAALTLGPSAGTITSTTPISTSYSVSPSGITPNSTQVATIQALHHPTSSKQSRQHESGTFIPVAITLCSLAALLACFRFFELWIIRGWLGTEDVFLAASCACFIVATALGCKVFFPEPQIKGSQRFLYLKLYQIFYILICCFNKLAFFALYTRILHGKASRFICGSAALVIVSAAAGFVVATVAQTVSCTKNEHHPGTKGHHQVCANGSPFLMLWAIINSITYLLVCAVPFPVMLRLSRPVWQRIGTYIVFTIGVYFAIASTLRLDILILNGPLSVEKTLSAMIWTQTEAAAGLIGICLPSLCTLLARLLSKRYARAWAEDSESRSPDLDNFNILYPCQNRVTISALGRRGDSPPESGISVRHDFAVSVTTIGTTSLEDFFVPRGSLSK